MALSLLERIGNDANEYSLSDLSMQLKLNKNRVFRLLASLEYNDFIAKNKQTGGYRLGYKTLSLGRAYLNNRPYIRTCRPVLEKISNAFNETVCLISFKKNSLIVEDIVESSFPVRAVLRVGDSLTMNCSAAGRLFTTCAVGARNENPSNQLTRKAGESLANDNTFVIEISDTGVVEIAAPIRNQDLQVIGAISVHGPTSRLAIEPYMFMVSHKVNEAAAEISNLLGYCSQVTMLDNYQLLNPLDPPQTTLCITNLA